jgi:hypothetical protein
MLLMIYWLLDNQTTFKITVDSYWNSLKHTPDVPTNLVLFWKQQY